MYVARTLRTVASFLFSDLSLFSLPFFFRLSDSLPVLACLAFFIFLSAQRAHTKKDAPEANVDDVPAEFKKRTRYFIR